MYPPELTAPMRQELVDMGVQDLTTPEQVDSLVKGEGTALVVINSVCGCAAGNARPGVAMALNNDTLPQRMGTVFAGVDKEATDRARDHIVGYPPSSPSIALFKNGEPVFVLERHMIEGRGPQEIAYDLVEAFDKHCG